MSPKSYRKEEYDGEMSRFMAVKASTCINYITNATDFSLELSELIERILDLIGDSVSEIVASYFSIAGGRTLE